MQSARPFRYCLDHAHDARRSTAASTVVDSILRRSAGTIAAFAALSSCACHSIQLDFSTDGSPSTGSAGSAGAPSTQDGNAPIPAPPMAPELLVTNALNLSNYNSPARDCADGGEIVSYELASLDEGVVTLRDAPSAGCLVPGDEVLLIEMQGNVDDDSGVGQHELLRVQAVDDTQLHFVSAPLLAYGPAKPQLVPDTNGSVLSWNDWQGRVLLQRVPSFSRLTVAEGAELSASAWGEGVEPSSVVGSGILALRVLGDALINGRVSMDGRGYRGGLAREQELSTGQQGESAAGLGIDVVEANAGGGGGGLGDQTTNGCVQNGNAGGGGGHLNPGNDAIVNDLCAGEGRGRGGLAYARAGRFFLGAGGGSGGVDNVRVDNPAGAPGGAGGGIVWLLSQSLSGSGSISARGAAGAGDPDGQECVSSGSTSGCYDHSGVGGGGAGGTVVLSAANIAGISVDVAGGQGGNGYDLSGGNGGDGSVGVIYGL